MEAFFNAAPYLITTFEELYLENINPPSLANWIQLIEPNFLNQSL